MDKIQVLQHCNEVFQLSLVLWPNPSKLWASRFVEHIYTNKPLRCPMDLSRTLATKWCVKSIWLQNAASRRKHTKYSAAFPPLLSPPGHFPSLMPWFGMHPTSNHIVSLCWKWVRFLHAALRLFNGFAPKKGQSSQKMETHQWALPVNKSKQRCSYKMTGVFRASYKMVVLLDRHTADLHCIS